MIRGVEPGHGKGGPISRSAPRLIGSETPADARHDLVTVGVDVEFAAGVAVHIVDMAVGVVGIAIFQLGEGVVVVLFSNGNTVWV